MKNVKYSIIFISIIISIFFNCVKGISNYRNDTLLKKGRKALITDINGEKFEVNNIKFEYFERYDFRFVYPYNKESSFYIMNKPIEYALPLSIINSIIFKGNNCEVNYKFMDKENTVTGKFLRSAKFKGETKYGNFEIETFKVKEIKFIDDPVKITPAVMKAEIILNNGEVIKARDLKVIDLFIAEGHSIYIDWAPMETFVHKRNQLIFNKGELELSIPIQDVRKINFDSKNKKIAVKMKNNDEVEGDFIPFDLGKKRTIDGISGVSFEGGFFISVDLIKEIKFVE